VLQNDVVKCREELGVLTNVVVELKALIKRVAKQVRVEEETE